MKRNTCPYQERSSDLQRSIVETGQCRSMEALLCGSPYATKLNHSTFGHQGDSTFGQQWNSTIPQPDSGLHELECLVDGLNLLPHMVVLPIAVMLVAVVGHCRHHDYTRLQSRLCVLFPGHSVRWMTILALLFVTMSEVGEGVLSDSFTPGHHPHLYVPWIMALLATVLGSVFYNLVEKLNRPRLLLILGLYHILSGGFKLLRLSHLYSRGVSTGSLRFQLTWASVLLYGVLVAVEGYVLYKKRYLSTTPVEVPVPNDLQDEAMRFALPYASLPSWFSFSWMDWLLLLGYKQPLQAEQLGRLPEENADRTGKQLSLWGVYIRAFLLSREFGLSGFLMLMTQVFLLISPLLLKLIIIYVTMETDKQTEESIILQERYMVTPWEFLQNGFVLLVLLLVVSVLRTGAQATSMALSFKVGKMLECGMKAMIYNKCLRLPSWLLENDHISMGQVTNHMNEGCTVLNFLVFLFHFSWASLFQLIAGSILLYYQLGWNAVLAVGFLVILLPVDLLIMKKMHDVNTKKMAKTDVRLKWINESIQGIKLLKLYAWEYLFVGKVTKARKDEIRQLYTHAGWNILAIFCNNASPLVATLIAFGSYEYFNDQPLTSADAFTALALFYTLHGPFSEIPGLLGLFTAASVATNRLGPFLQSLEVEGLGEGLRYGAKAEQMNGNVTADNSINESTNMGQHEHTEDSSDTKFNLLRAQADYNLTDDVSVELRHGSFTWEPESQTANISGINLVVPKGKLTIVVGQVGSGKSSLLSAMLGEMRTLEGQVLWNKKYNTVSYAAQRAWLLNASLRDNVTFGLPFDHVRYQQVISACCLQPDIDILPAGDLTEIGEKGINLSGGQKQRVSVARAMYAQTDIVLLDDPLSALDAHVGSHLFDQGIMGQLVKDCRTVVLVTHKLQYLEYAHLVVAMEKGRVIARGTLEEIRESSPDLHRGWMEAISECVRQIDEGLEPDAGPLFQNEDQKPDRWKHQGSGAAVVAEHLLQNRLSHHLSVSSLAASVEDVWVRRTDWPEGRAKKDEKKAVQDTQYGDKEKQSDGELGKLVETEERMEGDVKLTYYAIFAAACGLHLAILVLILQVCKTGVTLAMDFWLADWSSSNADFNYGRNHTNYTQGNESQPMDVPDATGYYITGYTGLSVGAIALTAAAVAASILTSLRGARVMHDRMVHNVVRAPLRFFDTTPTGRILNRMAGDQGILDNNLPGEMGDFLSAGLKVVSAIIAVAVITPYFLIGMIPIIVFYYFMQKFYRATARELQRIESIKRSPVYSQLSESFGGLSTIRAYRAEERFMDEMMTRINVAFTPTMYLMGVECWIAVRLVCAGAVIIFVAGLSSVVAGLYGLVSPAWVGLAISYAIRMQVELFLAVNSFAKVETFMTSVERVDTYSRVPQEVYQHKSGNTIPPEEWPKSGTVQLESVSARYDQTLDPVLTMVTANIRAGEKVGICGRTGSGKSSLTLALYRMIDMFEGVISIDGVDISRVPLTLLRSRLSIIPQDPVLFSGTIRFNLDPEENSDDEELWKAIEIAQLKDVVADLPNKLDEMVTEGGENFSVGQRQLFCLARAFVRKSRILIMDEATASVDMETDAILQEVIKVAFGDRTVVTVAHRIATILNSDRILVLDQGKLVENDSPENLLKKPDGLFTTMVKANK
ncbi:ATP-binding cassette sub-family C member 9-like isoform X2 [Branchiostoma floridae]|uniref:ATP-binding cassette sub-family C member 9-like isoform X2 n=1 Tax=Branchiostoma floridae TaxID=7739 RepID=A0A9J7HNC0_BRAFL|nr:ATP-binding cassette sub-family C member 9-like isoform X2 [Branchiostoma floridae]